MDIAPPKSRLSETGSLLSAQGEMIKLSGRRQTVFQDAHNCSTETDTCLLCCKVTIKSNISNSVT